MKNPIARLIAGIKWRINPKKRDKLMSRSEADHWRDQLAERMQSRFGLSFHPLQTDEVMCPPPEVIGQVQGRSKGDPTTFLGGGYRQMCRYLDDLDRFGADVGGMERILDFGVGTGRMMLQFMPFSAELHGCDANPPSYEWTKAKYAEHAQIVKTEFDPPLPYEDDQFDLITASSVFTHIRHDDQPGWIAELGRVIKPGGHMIVTVHDFSKFADKTAQTGFHEIRVDRGFHMNTYMTEEHLRKLWSTHFEVLGVSLFTPKQAHVILRRLSA